MVAVETAALRKAVDAIGGIVMRVTTIPILQCLAFKAEGGMLKIYASDLDRNSVHDVACDGEISFCANADAVRLFLRAAQASETTINAIAGGMVEFKAGACRSRIKTLSFDDFPMGYTTEPADWIEIEGSKLRRAGQCAVPMLDPKEPRLFCKSVALEPKTGSLRLDATNGHMGIRKHIPFGGRVTFDRVVVDPSFFELVPEAPCELGVSGGLIWVRNQGRLTAAKMVDVEWPDLELLYAKQSLAPDGTATIDRDSAISAIKTAGQIGEDTYRACNIFARGDVSSVYAAGGGDASIEVPIESDGDRNLNTVAHSKYLQIAFGAIDAETVSLTLTGGSRLSFASEADPGSQAFVGTLRAAPHHYRPEDAAS